MRTSSLASVIALVGLASAAPAAQAQLYTPTPSLMNGFIGANALAHQGAYIRSRQGYATTQPTGARTYGGCGYRRCPTASWSAPTRPRAPTRSYNWRNYTHH